MKSRRIFWFALILFTVVCGGLLLQWERSSRAGIESLRSEPPPQSNLEFLGSLPATNIIVIGSFSYSGPNNRHPDLPAELANHLLALHRTNLIFIDRNATNAPDTPADWVLNGSYSTSPAANMRTELKLERIQGGSKSILLDNVSGAELNQRIASAVAEAVTNLKDLKGPTSKRSEADLHLRQGIALTAFKSFGISRPINPNSSEWDTEPEKGRARFQILQAIRSLEASLKLEPTRAETKVYLGACFELPFIDRMREARKLYWEVIQSGEQGAWVQKARLRYALSYNYENPKRALDLLRTFEEEAPNPEQARIFRSFADSIGVPAKAASGDYLANKKTALIQTLETEMEALKDARRWPSTLPQVHYIARTDTPGKETQESEQGWQFIQELKPRFPELYPYLVFNAVREVEKPPAGLLAEAKNLIAQLRADPEKMFRPKYFYEYNVQPLALSLFAYDAPTAMEAAALAEEAHNKGLGQESSEELRMAKGYGFMQQEKWQDALAVFETLGNRTVKMSRAGPWNCSGGCPSSAPDLAQQCRAKLGIATAGSELHRTINRALLGSRGRIAMASDGEEVFVATTEEVFVLDGNGEPKRQIAFKAPPKVTAMALTSTRIYFGTEADGIVTVDRKFVQTNSYRIKDGLLFDSVTDLAVIGDKLWIGYGHGVVRTGGYWGFKDIFGGVGYLDLAAEKYVSFPSSESTEFPRFRYNAQEEMKNPDGEGFQARNVTPGDAMPPSRPVYSLSAAPDGSVYMAVPGRGIRHYEPKENRWTTFNQSPNQVTAVEASGNYLCVAEAEQYAELKDRSLWLRHDGDKRFKFLSVKAGLPHEDVYSLLRDGDTLWIGGYGYVAALDLTQSKLTRIYSIKGCNVLKMARTKNQLWIASDRMVYCERL